MTRQSSGAFQSSDTTLPDILMVDTGHCVFLESHGM